MSCEYWYDARHTGALRVVDHDTLMIYGSDPKEKEWRVPFEYVDASRARLRVDFCSKKTHHGARVMEPTYAERRNVLRWPDGNEWRRLRVDPSIVLGQHARQRQRRGRR